MVRSSRRRGGHADLVSRVAVPAVDVAARRLGGGNGSSLFAAVAGGRLEVVEDVVATGRQHDSDVARRTVGDLDAVAARVLASRTALVAARWRRIRAVRLGTLDRAADQSVLRAVQRSRQALAGFARRLLDAARADAVGISLVRARQLGRRYNSTRSNKLLQEVATVRMNNWSGWIRSRTLGP